VPEDTGTAFRDVACRRCDALLEISLTNSGLEFRCVVGKDNVLTGTSASHPGVSEIRGNKATLPCSGVDGWLFT
jgi:hypothetical protein